jgi:hypothetical protein
VTSAQIGTRCPRCQTSVLGVHGGPPRPAYSTIRDDGTPVLVRGLCWALEGIAVAQEGRFVRITDWPVDPDELGHEYAELVRFVRPGGWPDERA